MTATPKQIDLDFAKQFELEWAHEQFANIPNNAEAVRAFDASPAGARFKQITGDTMMDTVDTGDENWVPILAVPFTSSQVFDITLRGLVAQGMSHIRASYIASAAYRASGDDCQENEL